MTESAYNVRIQRKNQRWSLQPVAWSLHFSHQFSSEVTISYEYVLHILSRTEVCEGLNLLHCPWVCSCSHGPCGMSQVLKAVIVLSWWNTPDIHQVKLLYIPAVFQIRRTASSAGGERRDDVLLYYTASSAGSSPGRDSWHHILLLSYFSVDESQVRS